MTGLESGLRIVDLDVSYGRGTKAVNSASLKAPLSQITGLIGPNGAGKTTLFNAVSGLIRPDGGRIELLSRDVTHRSPSYRARLGLGRTFQRPQSCPDMTVRHNVGLGLEARLSGAQVFRQLIPTRGQQARVASAVDAALTMCGIDGLAGTPAGELTLGQLRMMELARAIAGGYRFLLLDEPSSGLDDDESAMFGRILRQFVDAHEIGVLIVEHNTSLVMEICQYIYVLDYGRQIFDGLPDDVRASEAVRAAYLGDAEAAEPSHRVRPFPSTSITVPLPEE
jgi:ABC-type branched-subunit amino acid transport system ATPase component